MENTSDLNKNKPQTEENLKITRVSGGQRPLAAAAAEEEDDDKKAGELPSGDGTVSDGKRIGKRNAGDGQKASGQTTTRKRAREAEEGGSGKIEKQQGGDSPVVEEPPCPLSGSGSVLNGTNTTCMQVSVNLTRPVPRGTSSSSSSPSTPSVSTEEMEDIDKPSADAPKAGEADFDLNVKPFLVPDLNQYPPENYDQI